MRTVAIITARGGSRRVPGKNLRPLAGRPLIDWTIASALTCGAVDRVVVSTEDDAIAAQALAAGADVPFRRPAELASDSASSADTVLHALETLRGMGDHFDFAVLLQPTSPFRTAADIEASLALLSESGAETCVSVSVVSKRPTWFFDVDANGRMTPMVDGDNGPSPKTVYMLNGAVYAFRVAWFLEHRRFRDDETVALTMPEERSLDIDTPHEFHVAEALAAADGLAPCLL